MSVVKIGDVLLRGLEKPIILWLLAHKPRHGYALIIEFKRLTGRKLKPSIVYPFLHKLEEKGFANAYWVAKGGRRIKHYSLTKSGEDLLRKMKSVFAKPFKEVLTDLIEKEGEKLHAESG